MPEPVISSLQNPRIKNAIKLRDRRRRSQQKRILIDGARELSRAIASGIQVVEAFVCPTLCQSTEAQQVLEALVRCRAIILEVTPAVFEKLAFGERAEGVLGIAETPEARLEQLDLPERPLLAVLEGIEKPGNVGAVLRSADAAGLAAVIVANGRTDLYNPNAIRASLGTIFTQRVLEATSSQASQWLTERRIQIVAARVDGQRSYTDVDYRLPTAIVLGSEANGLSAAWSGPAVTAVKLPMRGAADSLNVSATAAVMFYEALRQRQAGARR